MPLPHRHALQEQHAAHVIETARVMAGAILPTASASCPSGKRTSQEPFACGARDPRQDRNWQGLRILSNDLRQARKRSPTSTSGAGPSSSSSAGQADCEDPKVVAPRKCRAHSDHVASSPSSCCASPRPRRKALSGPLSFARLVRLNLMHRRRIDNASAQARPPKNASQIEFHRGAA